MTDRRDGDDRRKMTRSGRRASDPKPTPIKPPQSGATSDRADGVAQIPNEPSDEGLDTPHRRSKVAPDDQGDST